jgi:hypothetical protein
MNLKLIQSVGFIYAAVYTVLLLGANIPALFYQEPFWAAPMPLSFILLFPMWGVMIYYLNQVHKKDLDAEVIQDLPFMERLKLILNNPPQWLLVLTVVFYGYGMYCMFLWFTGGTAEPMLIDGKYQSSSHGKVTYYTEAEYLIAHRNNILATTGIPLTFAVVAFTAFFPKRGDSSAF